MAKNRREIFAENRPKLVINHFSWKSQLATFNLRKNIDKFPRKLRKIFQRFPRRNSHTAFYWSRYSLIFSAIISEMFSTKFSEICQYFSPVESCKLRLSIEMVNRQLRRIWIQRSIKSFFLEISFECFYDRSSTWNFFRLKDSNKNFKKLSLNPKFKL